MQIPTLRCTAQMSTGLYMIVGARRPRHKPHPTVDAASTRRLSINRDPVVTTARKRVLAAPLHLWVICWLLLADGFGGLGVRKAHKIDLDKLPSREANRHVGRRTRRIRT